MSAIINTGLAYLAANFAGNTVNINTFVFANISGLDDSLAVDPDEVMPAGANIVATVPVTQSGYVNPDAVVYSVMLTSDMGDYSFNWIGLVASDGTLVAVDYSPVIQKVKTTVGLSGNNLTHSFLMPFKDAAAAANINVSADTWMLDFNGWLNSLGEHERKSNEDIYGEQRFFSSGFEVWNDSGIFKLKAGAGFINGIRVIETDQQALVTGALPKDVWVDASLQGDINGVDAVYSLVFNNSVQSDFVDGANRQHYLEKIASINVAGVVTDLRSVFDDKPLLDYIVSEKQLTDKLNRLFVFPEIQTASNVFAMSDNGNGTVKIHSGQPFLMRGWQLFSTADFNSAELTLAHAANKTYHIRFSADNGFDIYDLSSGVYNPALDVDDDELFDSTYDDMLIARVVTDGANVPTIKQLKNANELSLFYHGSLNSSDVVADGHGNLGGSVQFDLDWARSPAYDHFSQAVNGYAFGVTGYPTDIFVAKNNVYSNPSAPTIFAAVDKSYVRNRYSIKIPVIESKAATGSFAATYETWFVYELSVGT